MSRILPILCILLLHKPISANAPLRPSSYDLKVPPFGGFPGKKIKLERDDANDVVRILIPRKMALTQAAEPAGRGRTVVAGLALTAAFVTGGLWLCRQRPRGTMQLAAALAVSVGVAGCFWWEKDEPKTPAKRLTFAGAGGDARIWLTDEGDEIRIILPKKDADRIKAK